MSLPTPHQMCRADVPTGVCTAAGGEAGGQALLPALGQHAAASQGGSPDEGMCFV